MSNKLVRFLKDATVVVIIGMGNELRADDAVGLYVVRLLKPSSNTRLEVFEGHMTPEVYIGPACASHPSHVLIVDAAELGKKPGAWQILSADNIDQGLFTTHTIPAVEVAAEIKRRCNAYVVFLGIQPKSRDISLGLSRECQQAAEEIARVIQETVS
ncbi:MAG: hydrogenase 3 maturation endopeptidase HyCI [Euryarchaeota archaeon]|nr:hydrogenase 3 maturation endopeptidase HyCI [Euryarchaeota archaeon]